MFVITFTPFITFITFITFILFIVFVFFMTLFRITLNTVFLMTCISMAPSSLIFVIDFVQQW